MFNRDWLALEFYAYPHLMGEAADYEIDEEEGGEVEMALY